MRVKIITGPTCSGKTRAALDYARKHGAEIISCDSVQIYRGMDIGSAKPTKAELAEIPHHLIDVAEPSEKFDVAQYVELAKAALADEEAIERELQMSSKGGAVSEREVIERSISNDNERIRELERVIGRLYEDMVSGKLNEDTFNSILEQKQAEQAMLKNRVRLNSERLAEREQEEIDSVRWIETIKEYADIRELDATTLNRLIRVIVIHEDLDGETVRQTVEIHWNFKGTSENA